MYNSTRAILQIRAKHVQRDLYIHKRDLYKRHVQHVKRDLCKRKRDLFTRKRNLYKRPISRRTCGKRAYSRNVSTICEYDMDNSTILQKHAKHVKRDLCIRKRNLCKRPTRDARVESAHIAVTWVQHVNITWITALALFCEYTQSMSKETCIYTRETYTRDTQSMSKETCVYAKETCTRDQFTTHVWKARI